VGKVTQGLVLDLAVFAVGTPKQMCAIDGVFVLTGRCDDVGSSIASSHALEYSHKNSNVN